MFGWFVLLVWKQSWMFFLWYGHAFGFPDRHPVLRGGAVCALPVAVVLVGCAWLVGVRWFENWIVDASRNG